VLQTHTHNVPNKKRAYQVTPKTDETNIVYLSEPAVRKLLAKHMGKLWTIQSSLHLLNDVCADSKTFSYDKLMALNLHKLALQANSHTRELTMLISTDEDYKILLWHLNPQRRTYQLLGLHFKKVHIVFGDLDESVSMGIHLKTLSLEPQEHHVQLRDPDALGSRLRRALNAALQGHVGVLKLRSAEEVEDLKEMWARGRITQLMEKHGIVPFDDASGSLVKLWKPRESGERPEDDETEIVIIVD